MISSLVKGVLIGGVGVAGGFTVVARLEPATPEPARQARAQRRQRLLRGRQTSTRHSHLHAIASSEDLATNRRVHRKLNRNILVSGSTVVVASAGALLWTPLSYLSVIGIILVSRHALRDAVALWSRERRIGVDAMSVMVKLLLLVNFQFVLCGASVLIYAVNRKMMHTVRDHSTQNMIDVFRQTPREVWILQGEVERQVPLETVTCDDVVVVHAGEMIPVDGLVMHGSATVDQHVLTGESQPAEKHTGDEILALTVVLSGRLCIRAERTGEDTTAAQIAQILTRTVDVKTDMQLWAETMTDRTVLPTCLLGLATMPWIGPLNATALVYSHPKYKTTLTGSISLLNGLNMAAHHGILVKDGRSLELLERVDTVVFDKTGTLTSPEPRVGEIHCVGRRWNRARVLRLAAAAEYKQSHPIAHAILHEAERQDLAVPPVEHTDYHLGHGLRVQVEGQEVRVGSASFMELAGLEIPARLRRVEQLCHAEARPLVMVAVDRQVVGAIELHASIRPEAAAVIQGLRRRGVAQIVIISGDHDTPTRLLAEELGVDRYFAQTLPEQKADRIAELQSQGRTVCYVGDGINDAVALRQADVSVSLSGASSVAMDAAGVVLMDASLNHLETLFDVARGVQRNIRQTFTLVFVPHLVSALGAGLLIYHGMVPAMVLTMAGLLAGAYNGSRRFIRLEPPTGTPLLPEKTATAQPDSPAGPTPAPQSRAVRSEAQPVLENHQ